VEDLLNDNSVTEALAECAADYRRATEEAQRWERRQEELKKVHDTMVQQHKHQKRELEAVSPIHIVVLLLLLMYTISENRARLPAEEDCNRHERQGEQGRREPTC